MRIIVSFLFILVLISTSCSSKQEGVYLSKKTLRVSVYASAKVIPENERTYYASSPGIVEKIYVDEGDAVLENEPLILVNKENQEIIKNNAAIQKSIAQKKQRENWSTLQNLRDQINLAKENMMIDSLEWVNRVDLWKQKIGSKKELDLVFLKYQRSKNEYNSLKNQYKSLESELKDQYNIASNNYKQATIKLNNQLVTAEKKSLVYDMLVEEGQFVSNNSPLAVLGDSSNFLIELQIDENDITSIEIGQHVILSLDAFTNKIFEATITKIYPSKIDRTQTFKVEAKFLHKEVKLFKGLNGEANIIISTKNNIYCLPRAYVKDGKVNTNDGYKDITTGIFNYEYIEVLSELDTNKLIILPE